MMATKSPSPAALRRRIEKLEAEIEAMREAHRKCTRVYEDMLREVVDLKIRNRQAIRILQGADE